MYLHVYTRVYMCTHVYTRVASVHISMNWCKPVCNTPGSVHYRFGSHPVPVHSRFSSQPVPAQLAPRGPGPRVPLGPGPSWPLGARAQGALGAHRLQHFALIALNISHERFHLKKLRGTFWDIVLSRMRYLGGFRSSRCHGSNRKNEIYNLGLVPEPPELKQ